MVEEEEDDDDLLGNVELLEREENQVDEEEVGVSILIATITSFSRNLKKKQSNEKRKQMKN